MKVKELIQQLKSLDGDLDVIVSSDPINGASDSYRGASLASVDGSDCGFYDHIGIDELTHELRSSGYSEEDVLSKKVVLIS